jgi:predicted ATPase/class 3 adenylate cyclase/DNA-binding CsgD family transcriptional regulator
VDAPGVGQATLHLPVGTVTFLLSDVAGSTLLWESDPEAMSAAIARHDELLDAAVALHSGVRPVEHSEGDSVVAVFTRASDALAAALDLQLAFHAEPWPAGAPLRDRIALHTAQTQLPDEGDSFGQGLNRCARLRAIAHGGQVVVSATTHDLVLDRLPDGAVLAALGTHRLQDLGRPEHVFELRHPDLPGDFPRLRSLDAFPNNLPSELTSFVGRRRELTQVGELLRRTRLLTLTGAGGCGKTRIALQAAADALDRNPDGAWWVELARLEDAALLPAIVNGAIGLPEVPGWTPVDVFVEHLRSRSALLVLNNCEHVLAECAALVDSLLRACPLLTILATSRAPLGVPGETSWRVPSMSMPAEPHRQPAESLRQCDAVRLFIDRALQVRPNFAVTAANAPAVAQICSDLDGMPLAIELAAARVRVLAPEQIAGGLADRFHMLTGGGRTVTPRHQTLEASIDWSHELLSHGERALLRRVSVFAGGWTLDAAEEVCAGDGIDRSAVLDLLSGLVDKSLVTTDEGDSEVRYGLLKTVRQYASERLSDAGEVETMRDRHLAYSVALAERAEPEVFRSGRDDPALRRLADEVPNLRAALEWATGPDAEAGLRIAAAMNLFWLFAGRYGEGEAACARALDAAGAMLTPLRALVLTGRATLGIFRGAYLDTPGWAQAALEIGEACGDLGVQARACDILGCIVAVFDPPSGRPILERSVELARRSGDDRCLADALQWLAWCLIFQDEFDAARGVLDDSYATARRLGYRWGAALYWLSLARITKLQGRLDESQQLLERMVTASDEVGDPMTRTVGAAGLAWIALERGQAEVARELISGPLAQVTETGAGIAMGFANQVMARVDLFHGDLSAARRHLQLAIESDSAALAYFLPEHLSLLATLERIEGNLGAAHDHLDEALEVARRVGSGWMQAFAGRTLARLALADGDAGEAERCTHDALAHLLRGSLALGIPNCFDLLAAVATFQESFEEAARLLGAAAASRGRVGIVRFPPEPEFWTGIEDTTRAKLGEEAYQAAFSAGAALDMDEAVAYARRARGERKRPSIGWDSLTPTELEVVRHIAGGGTNRQIGEHMFISAGTVKIHLSHVFAKLDIASRSQLAAEATKRGIAQG